MHKNSHTQTTFSKQQKLYKMNDLAIAFASAPVDLGNQNFQTEVALFAEKNIGIKFTNNTAADKNFLVCKSYMPTAGVNIATDGTVDSVAIVSSKSDFTVEQFIQHTREIPTRVPLTLVRSNNPIQFNTAIVVREKQFGNNKAAWAIDLSQHIDPINPNTSVLQVSQPLNFDPETEIMVTIPARIAEGNPTITTFTFNAGAEYSTSKGLYEISRLAGAKV